MPAWERWGRLLDGLQAGNATPNTIQLERTQFTMYGFISVMCLGARCKYIYGSHPELTILYLQPASSSTPGFFKKILYGLYPYRGDSVAWQAWAPKRQRGKRNDLSFEMSNENVPGARTFIIPQNYIKTPAVCTFCFAFDLLLHVLQHRHVCFHTRFHRSRHSFPHTFRKVPVLLDISRGRSS